MTILNTILNTIFRWLLYPFETLSPWVGLVVTAALTSVFMLWVFRLTSNQAGLSAAKRRIHAGLFEMRLYQDDLRALFAAQREVLRFNLTYLRHTLKPFAWLILPVVLILVQLDLRYGYKSLEPGQAALVRVRFAESIAFAPGELRLEVPEGLRVETRPLRIPHEQEVDWRIRAEEVGAYRISVVAGEESFVKEVLVGPRLVPRSPRRGSGWLDALLYPSEPAFAGDASVRSIEITYREERFTLWGFRMHWMVPFFVLSVAIAFALRKPFKVVI